MKARTGVTGKPPTLKAEAELHAAGHVLVAGVDEVGRGALAGPVSVGVVVIDAGVRRVPRGLRDSKLLTPAARAALVPALRRWPVAWAVGHTEADEIDVIGIIAALRRAAWRALESLPVTPDAVLLDGNHDWLSREAGELPVTTRIKADMTCASVAAASVLAKTTRDAIMVQRASAWPDYDWASNKGYAAPSHLESLVRLGPTSEHRRSWRLPTASLDVPLPFEIDVTGGLTDTGCGVTLDLSQVGREAAPELPGSSVHDGAR